MRDPTACALAYSSFCSFWRLVYPGLPVIGVRTGWGYVIVELLILLVMLKGCMAAVCNTNSVSDWFLTGLNIINVLWLWAIVDVDDDEATVVSSLDGLCSSINVDDVAITVSYIN